MRYYILILFCFTFIVHACNPVTERMHSFAVHGIDVSHYQARINWDTVALNAIDFGFVKATEGEIHNDSLFCYNWDEMKRTGIKRGAYHFFRPTLSPFLQARNFTSLVEMHAGDLPPVLDVEVMDGVSTKSLVKDVRIWLELTELFYGTQPIIYTNLKFYHQHLAGHFDDYPIWIARYNTIEPQLTTNKQWDFWQYGNRGRVNGVDGFVDLNVFHGSRQQLDAMGYQPKTLYSQMH